MKTIVKTTLPTCDICRGTAKYDAPTIHGPWANMCQPCYDANGSLRAPEVGFAFTTVPTVETTRDEAIAVALEMGHIELAVELVGDGDLVDYL